MPAPKGRGHGGHQDATSRKAARVPLVHRDIQGCPGLRKRRTRAHAPSTRLPGIVGRGRAFETVLGGEDFGGELAERYGYVNRAAPDDEFVSFTDAYAQRVSRFDRRTLTDIKGFINAASLPDDLPLTAEMRAFGEAINREPALLLIPAAFKAGWGQPGEFEQHIAELTADK